MQYGVPKSFSKGIGDLVSSFLTPARAAPNDSPSLYDRARAEEIATRMLAKRKAVRSMPMIASGLTDPQAQQVGEYYATGSWGAPTPTELPYQIGSDEVFDAEDQARTMQTGGLKRIENVPARQPAWATPDAMNRYNMGRMLAAATQAGKSNAQQIASALGSFRDQQMIGDMVAGMLDPNLVAQSYAAISGKPMYDQGSSGVGHRYTGSIAPTDRTMAATLEDLATADAQAAMADARQAQGRYYDARAQAPAGGSTSAQVQLFQYLQANGMDFNQAAAFIQSAKYNPMKAQIDLARMIMNSSGYNKPTPEKAMEEAAEMIKTMDPQPWAQSPAGAGTFRPLPGPPGDELLLR